MEKWYVVGQETEKPKTPNTNGVHSFGDRHFRIIDVRFTLKPKLNAAAKERAIIRKVGGFIDHRLYPFLLRIEESEDRRVNGFRIVSVTRRRIAENLGSTKTA